MSATIEISETNTSSATVTDGVTNLNMGSVDSPNLDPSTNVIASPGNSYEKWERVHITSMGGATKVDNLRIYLSSVGSGFVQGESMVTNLVTSGYTEATYPSGGPVATASTVATRQMPTSMPGSSNIGIGGVLSGSFTAVPAYSDYFVLQEQIQANVPSGALQQKVLSVVWDEM